jgi:signal transduction histidine kinase
MESGIPREKAPTPPARPDLAQLLEHEQLKLLYDYLPISQLIAVINAVVFVAVQSLVIGSSVLIGWLYVVCMVALIRIGSGLAFRSASDQATRFRRWRAYAVAGAAVSGAAWGSAALLLFPPMNVAHQVFVAFMLGGMVAGSVTTLAPVFPAFVVFAAFTLGPAVIRFTLEHGIIQYAMGWMTLVFLVAVTLIARRSHRSTYDLLRLRFENDALIAELLATQRMIEQSHDELEKRVAERTNELSQSNAELQRLAYVASHDLQEPLRNAANFALLLDARYRDRLDKDGREFLQIIVSGVKHMRTLVDDLLSHSRVGTAPQLEPVDCAALMDKVLATFQAAIAENGVSVIRGPLPMVEADSRQLQQVFTNLLSNAIKFRGEEPLRVEVSAEARDKEWIFTVRDNGIGFAPRYADQVFEMFERLHSQAEYPGTGIGLAVCKKIVEGHHGRIWVDTEEKRGAAFSFALPRTGRGGAAQGGLGAAGRDPAGGGQPG